MLTVTLIAVCLGVFFLLQSHDSPQAEAEFLYRRAVVSCEIVTGDPLSAAEISSQHCETNPGSPLFPDKSPLLAVLTSMFLHGSVSHVVFNMWFLWIFGNNVEEAFGRIGYILLYLVGGAAGTAAFVAANPESTVPLIGASGAIAAVLGAYAVLFPGHRVLSLVGWFVIPVPAAIFLGLWFLAQFGFTGSNIAWEAHAGGFIFGLVVALAGRASLLRRVRWRR